jgi:hypothetical protein
MTESEPTVPDREVQDGLDVESKARAMLCDEVEGLLEECRSDGTLKQLELILRDAAKGLPVVERMGAIGLTVDRGRGYTSIPGTRSVPASPTYYECPVTALCPRREIAGPGEFPKCDLLGKEMARLGSGTSP